jgi:antitoxin (DNA-binding transcriptional repressor) of toxin-antitoxin stability system
MTGMKTISATEFKAKCFDLLEHLPDEGVAISKRGKTIARIYPEKGGIAHLIGSIPDMHVQGDIQSTGTRWDAES